MIAPEVQKKVSRIQLHVKKLLQGFLLGDYRSLQKGYGLEFEQLRDYQLGDDIRFIDWKSTARMNKMLVKEYIHEQTKTIMVALDVSASNFYSSAPILKKDLMQQIASVLAFAADYSKARVGLLLFSDCVELYIPPRMGTAHTTAILKKIWEFEPGHKRTKIKNALEFLAKISKKDTLLFMISDFIDGEPFFKELGIIAQRYDAIMVRCHDTLEKEMPPLGYVHVKDSETGQHLLLNTKKMVHDLNHFLKKRFTLQSDCFRKYALDCVDIMPRDEYIDRLIAFFARRLLH